LLRKRSYFSLQKLLTNVNDVLNINIKIEGDEYIDDTKKIYVANHCSFVDALIVPRCIIAGAVTSVSNANNPFGKLMAECTHVYFVERGKSNNSVDKIQSHIEKNGSLILCPQGIFSHISTLPLFRTGAFATNFNVQPILLLYKQNISSLSMFNILFYPRIDATIKILPQTKRNETESVIDFTERVRMSMAKEGNLLLSSVSCRDIVD
jgi:1-acyl-sn-glycerol-3-phosphate acyltransferase